jgi:hypothetical protein
MEWWLVQNSGTKSWKQKSFGKNQNAGLVKVMGHPNQRLLMKNEERIRKKKKTIYIIAEKEN